MSFTVETPFASEFETISDIHLGAMASNLLLHAQFPNEESVSYLRGWLTRDTMSHAREPDKGVLVARDNDGKVVSFVKWIVHRAGKGDGGENDEVWPGSCRREYLDGYAKITEDVRRDVLGEHSYYHVTFICTDPDHAGRGAATSLMRQVLDAAAKDGMPVILESTMDSVAFYEKLGFEKRQGLEMMLPARGSDEPTEVYRETSMVFDFEPHGDQ